MSIRSRYSSDSYVNNRPLHRGGSRRNPVPTPIEDGTKDPCEACRTCSYKHIVEKAMEPEERVIQSTKTDARRPTSPESQMQKEPEQQKKGILSRFGAYVAKNQKAMRDAGEKTLGDEMGDWGKGILSGAGKLGQEEIDGLSRKKSVKKSNEEDDELIDFLSGKKRR